MDRIFWLRNHYLTRKEKNAYYSLRAFSRDLKVPSGRLSEWLSRKRQMSDGSFLKLAESLDDDSAVLANEEKNLLLKDPKNPNEDQFLIISDWQHYAILNLLKLKIFKSDCEWIAKRLGLDIITVREAIERLERLKLITIQNGKWVRTTEKLSTTLDIPSRALVKSHRQSLAKAEAALEAVPVLFREITSTTMPVDIAQINEAKKAIRCFKRRMSKIVEKGDRTEVYELLVSFVPLTLLPKDKLH